MFAFAMTMMFLLLLIVTTSPTTTASTNQYIPFSMPPNIPVVNLTDKTYPYRTNWCPTRAAVLNGTMAFALAIRDRTVYLSADPGFQGGPGNDAEFWKIKYDASTGYPVSGVIYFIWTALSTKLGFNIQWVNVNGHTTSTTTSIQNTVKYVDMYASGMTYDTAARRNIPASYLYPHILQDDMTILAPQTSITQYSLWSVFSAFSYNLWISLFCALLTNGLLTYMLSPRKRGPDGTTTLAKEGQTLFTDVIWAINAFAGVKIEEDRTVPIMILSIGCNLLILIVQTSYVANLAAVLISNPIVLTQPVSTFDDANARGLNLCILSGSAQIPFINKAYPNINLVPLSSPDFILGPSNGKCAAFITGASSWAAYSTNQLLNPNCNIVSTGDVAVTYSFGTPYYRDDNKRCTTFLADVLSWGMQQLEEEGTLDRIRSNSISAYSTSNCPVTAVPSLSIDPPFMAGIWIIYTTLAGIALLFHLFKILICKPMVIPALTRTDETPSGFTSGKALLPALKKNLPFIRRKTSTNNINAGLSQNNDVNQIT